MIRCIDCCFRIRLLHEIHLRDGTISTFSSEGSICSKTRFYHDVLVIRNCDSFGRELVSWNW